MIVPPGKTIRLKRDYDPAFTGNLISKKDAKELLAEGVQRLAEYQDKLYAQDTYSLLIVLQAMDAAGKDGTIKRVMSGLNPQGTQVTSFKSTSAEELDHTYLRRNFKALPERGRIGMFNRSYYEEVLVARVHPEILDRQTLPPDLKDKKVGKRRFEEINAFEKHLVNNGTLALKFFLSVSKEEQRRRFLARLDCRRRFGNFGSSGFSGIIVTNVRHCEERCSRRSNLSTGRKEIASQEALAMTMHRRFPAKVGRPEIFQPRSKRARLLG